MSRHHRGDRGLRLGDRPRPQRHPLRHLGAIAGIAHLLAPVWLRRRS